LVSNPFCGAPFANPEAYRKHANEVGGGDLFDMIFEVADQGLKDSMEKTVMMLELLCHFAQSNYSQTAWELSDFLYLSGVSDRNRRALYKKGFGMHPSKQVQHIKKVIGDHVEHVLSMLSDPGRSFVFIADDFFVPRRSRTPNQSGNFAIGVTVANTMLKEITHCNLDLESQHIPSLCCRTVSRSMQSTIGSNDCGRHRQLNRIFL
jgi:hypothetical protein